MAFGDGLLHVNKRTRGLHSALCTYALHLEGSHKSDSTLLYK